MFSNWDYFITVGRIFSLLMVVEILYTTVDIGVGAFGLYRV